MSACSTQVDNDNITVITSNIGSSKCEVANLTPPPPHFASTAFPLKMKDAIVDLGAMQIFIMEGNARHQQATHNVPLSGITCQWQAGVYYTYV
jgi:hypothetical protein